MTPARVSQGVVSRARVSPAPVRPRRRTVAVCVVVALGCILGGLAALDRLVRHVVEVEAERRLATRLPGVRGVEVALEGFPFTVDLARGRIDGVHVRIDAIHDAGMRATDLRADVRGVELDVGSLLHGGELVVEGVEVVTAEASIDAALVAEVVGRPIEIIDGRVFEDRPEGRVGLEVTVNGPWIELYEPDDGSLPLVFPLPPLRSMPCEPRVRAAADRLRVSCSVEPRGVVES